MHIMTYEPFSQTFEGLVKQRVFIPAGAGSGSSGVLKEFVRYRCAISREEIGRVVDASGQTNLKRWFKL